LTRLASANPQAARLVELRYFAGLPIPEEAHTLGVSPRTADRHWAFARAWLLREVSGDAPDRSAPRKNDREEKSWRDFTRKGGLSYERPSPRWEEKKETMNEQAIFLAALDKDPSERAAFLDEACAGDARLRRGVETLLRLDAESHGFLDVPAPEQLAA